MPTSRKEFTQRIVGIAQSTARIGKQFLILARTTEIPHTFILNYTIFIAFVGLLVVWLFFLVQERIYSFSLGYTVIELEEEKQRLTTKLRSLEARKAYLLSSSYLLQMNQAMGIYLLPPHERWSINEKK